jgi:hypothetical protein
MIDRWVDSYHGKNSNPGTRAFPWQTIQYGVNWLASHKNQADEATLHILNYQCTENVRMRGAKYSWIRVVGEAAAVPQPDVIPQFCEARPRVVASDQYRPVFEISSAEYVRLTNLDISGGNGGVKASSAPGLRLEDCCIHDNDAAGPGGGFAIGRDCEHARVSGCRIWANTSSPPTAAAGGGGGSITRSKDVRVRDSVFVNNEAVNGNGGALFIDSCEQIEVLSCTIGSRPRSGRPASGGNQAESGGGIFITASQKVWLGGAGDGNIVTDNVAAVDGGGVAVWKGTNIRMRQNTITRSEAGGNGGGVSVQGHSSLTAARDHVTENQSVGDGAGFYANDAALTLVEIEVDHNTTKKNRGGGLYVDGEQTPCTLVIKGGSKFHHNHAGWGGGLAAHKATVEMRQTTFESNKADVSGGGFNLSVCEAILETCEVISNTAKAAGGGAMISGPKKLRLSLFTFRSNQSRQGGGLHATLGHDCIVTDNTLESNQASESGGGMVAGYAERGSVIENHFRYNQAAEGAGLTCESCKIPPVLVRGNEFRQNAVQPAKQGHGGDIFLDVCTLGITAADIAVDNTVGGQVPVVEHT